jgi:hypothetical protein
MIIKKTVPGRARRLARYNEVIPPSKYEILSYMFPLMASYEDDKSYFLL